MFLNTIGILIATNCDPILTDLLLYSYEAPLLQAQWDGCDQQNHHIKTLFSERYHL
jgi:hypothetical protein